MTLPTFLIIGSQKAGTTTLYHVLRRHPDVCMAPQKEVNFFFRDNDYRRGAAHYAAHFAGHSGQRAVGEASPGYICHPDAPARIHDLLPDVRLVLTVRQPVDRAYSQYWDHRRKLTEHLTFADAYARYFDTVYAPGRVGYFSRGFYMTYIDRYLRRFDRDRLHVVRAETLQTDPHAVYAALFRFLGVDDTFRCPEMTARFNAPTLFANPLYRWLFDHPRAARVLPPALRRRTAFGRTVPFRYPPLDPALRRAITARYAASIDALAAFLDADLSGWLT